MLMWFYFQSCSRSLRPSHPREDRELSRAKPGSSAGARSRAGLSWAKPGPAVGSRGRAPAPPALLKLEQILPTGRPLVPHGPRDKAQGEDGAGQGGPSCPDPRLSSIPSAPSPGWALRGTQGLLAQLLLCPHPSPAVPSPAAPRARSRRCPGDAPLCPALLGTTAGGTAVSMLCRRSVDAQLGQHTVL